MAHKPPLLPFVRLSIERDPAGAAQLLKNLDETEAVAILRSLPPALSAQVFPHLGVSYGVALIKDGAAEVIEAVVKRMAPEQAASILMSLAEEQQKLLLDHLPDQVKKQLQELLAYPEGSAGRIMSTNFIAFNENMKVRETINRIRATASRYGPSTYTYVIDDENRLVGVLNMRDLVLAPPDEGLAKVMDKNVFAVSGFMSREELSHQLTTRHYQAAPVIDAGQRLVGVVRNQQLLEEAHEEATENILKMVGVAEDERTFSPVSFSLRQRLPWLYINLGTAFFASAVVSFFEDIIAKLTILAVFLPVVAGQGGNAGAQSLAVVMRGLVMREIRPGQAKQLIIKESTVGLLNGICIGLVTALIAWIWHGNGYLGLVIGLAMIVNLAAAGLAGAAIPLTMKAAGWDPAQCSSIFLTTVTDVVGFFSFLGFAVLFQNYLI